MERWQVDEADCGERLDRLIARRFAVARNQAQQWIRSGHVTVADQPRRVSYTLRPGDLVACAPQAKETALNLEPEDAPLEVLHEDDHVVAVAKPAGLAVHPGAGRATGTLVHRLLARYPEIGSVGGSDRPGVVHRLDLDTTGALLIARTELAYQKLSVAFAERQVVKKYLGTVFGRPPADSGVIDEPIGRHPKNRKLMTVRADGRSARTGYSSLALGVGCSLLELDLETGRTHQIRVHLKALGYPLVGDAPYAGNRWRGAPRHVQRVLAEFPRPALHAASIEFDHPVDGGRLAITAPIPGDLRELWHRVEIDGPVEPD